jgi:hypothetical protein
VRLLSARYTTIEPWLADRTLLINFVARLAKSSLAFADLRLAFQHIGGLCKLAGLRFSSSAGLGQVSSLAVPVSTATCVNLDT